MPDIDNLQITRLAKGIRIARGMFATAYDEFAASFDSPRFIQIAVESDAGLNEPNGTDRDERHYIAALRVARDAGWLVRFVFDKFGDLSAGAAPGTTLELQSIVNFTQRFADAKLVETGTLAASRRSCQIVISDTDAVGNTVEKAVGSGFLIGPHLVLTNHHVIAPLLGADGRRDPARTRPSVRFDYYRGTSDQEGPETVACAEDWLVISSPGAPVTAHADDLAGRLDYAVLRLDALPGHARGWYDLSKVAKPPDPGAILELWQFPQGQPMKVLPGPRVAAVAGLGFDTLPVQAVPPRIFYMINSAQGSSGGLVLDAHKLPVGLHDAGYQDNRPDDAKPNRGIPLALIRDHAGSFVTQALLDLPQKIGWHPVRRDPILGRQTFQRLVFEAQKGPVRLITVLTRPDAATGGRVPQLGRSYTHMIMEACLPAADHHIVEFNAAWIDPDPYLTARRLIETVDPQRVGELPGASGETTLDADATGVLVDATVRVLLGAALGKTVWLMIDDIDAHPIGTQWGASAYLIALYRRAAVERDLRIVLVGLPRQLEGVVDLVENGILAAEHLDAPPSDAELSFWVQAHLAESSWPSEFGPRLGRMIRSVAEGQSTGGGSGPGQCCLTEATAAVLARHARGAFLDKGGGNG